MSGRRDAARAAPPQRAASRGELLLKGGRIVDPRAGIDARLDLRLEDGCVAEVGERLAAREHARVIDCSGKVVVPGLIDAHVHLREPGREDEETIESGSLAALAGGFTSVLAMPNTDPVTDSQAAVGFIRAQAARAGHAHVYPIAAATRGSLGSEMSEIGDLVAAGAVAITDDGRPIADAGVMRRILEYSRIFDVPVVQHCEDLALTDGGVMHEGRISTRLGLKGIPAASEEVVVARDLILAELTGAHYHVAHLSTARSAELVAEAKRRGVRVTAEVTPHHLVLTEEAADGYDTQAKMNPPLRSGRDVEALREALAAGTLDIVATDHAPHHYDEKEREFDFAPFGILGLETAFGLLHTELVLAGRIGLADLIERMSPAPARIFHLAGGGLEVGQVADVTVLDLEREWTVEPEAFLSKSRNTPFGGRQLVGRAWMTIVDGQVAWRLDRDPAVADEPRHAASAAGRRSATARQGKVRSPASAHAREGAAR
ncbi:MAG: dihydroorotase [Gemmatimonadetes bacterium]|nr:dihydroorotase [Gemmatimonadota bacterium]